MNRIGVNLLYLIPGEVGGTEHYARLELARLVKSHTSDTFILFCNRENAATFASADDHVQVIPCQLSARSRIARILYEQCILPVLVFRTHCDEIRSFGYLGPVIAPAKRIVTVHDANWLDCPEDVSFLSRAIQSILMPLTIWSASQIVTDSAFARDRLLFHSPWIHDKLRVVEPEVNPELRVLLKKESKRPLKEPYFLCVSGLYPHKHIPYLLELFSKYEGKTHFVLIGRNGKDEERVRALVGNMPNVHAFSSVTLSELASYYQHAKAFLFPSTYEGFGYPVYEALEAGLPIVVGKKELYRHSIRRHLRQFTFDPEQDLKILETL